MVDQSLIRNFSIIAHIDHGKSTLADRILQLTGTVADRDMKDQLLDDMELERERGITIKLNAVSLSYTAKDGKTYLLHLIDTPGHVDFSYEVSRSLAACEGAILVVDAAQGVEAQTLANVYLALDNNLEILPVINKIDLPSADPDRVAEEVEDLIGLPADDAPRISAKTGLNVDQVLEEVVTKIPAPSGDINNPTQALIFDSFYDAYRGVIILVCVKEGKIRVGDHIHFMASDADYEVVECGVHTPREVKKDELVTGEVGWIAASIKSISDVHVGDTVTTLENKAEEPLPGYRRMNPMVYCGLYPIDNAKYKDLREALEKIAPVLIYPVVGILVMGLLMAFVVEPIMGGINTGLNNALTGMGSSSKVVLGIVLGGMMAIDMGGPFNKAAYVFGTAAIAAGNYDIMAAVMYLVALVVGTVISVVLLGLLKKKAA